MDDRTLLERASREVGVVASPSITEMQFKLIDAKNALQHAADTAEPEVAKVYRARALEVAEVISALSVPIAASGWHGCAGCSTPNDCRMHGCGVTRGLWKHPSGVDSIDGRKG